MDFNIINNFLKIKKKCTKLCWQSWPPPFWSQLMDKEITEVKATIIMLNFKEVGTTPPCKIEMETNKWMWPWMVIPWVETWAKMEPTIRWMSWATNSNSNRKVKKWACKSMVQSMCRLTQTAKILYKCLLMATKWAQVCWTKEMAPKERCSRSKEMDTMLNGKTWRKKVLRCLKLELSSTSTSNMEWNLQICQLVIKVNNALALVNVVVTHIRKCAVSMLSWPTPEMAPRTRCSDAWTTNSHQSTSKWRWITLRSTWNVLTPRAQPHTWPPLS